MAIAKAIFWWGFEYTCERSPEPAIDYRLGTSMMEGTYTVLVLANDRRTSDAVEERLSSSYAVDSFSSTVSLEQLVASEVVVLTESGVTSLFATIESETISPGDGVTIAVLGTDGEGGLVRYRSCTESIDSPLDSSGLRRRIDRLLLRARYDDLLTTYADLAERRGAIEATSSPDGLDDDEEYVAICEQSKAVRSELDALLDEFDVRDFDAAFATPDFSGGARIEQLS